MFQMAMSEWPFFVAMTDVTSSGSDVPTATMVRPMRISESPASRAMSTAHVMNAFPQSMSPASQMVASQMDFA